MHILYSIFNGLFHQLCLRLAVLVYKLVMTVFVFPLNSFRKSQFSFVSQEDKLQYFESNQKKNSEFDEVKHLLSEIRMSSHVSVVVMSVRVKSVTCHFIIG